MCAKSRATNAIISSFFKNLTLNKNFSIVISTLSVIMKKNIYSKPRNLIDNIIYAKNNRCSKYISPE